MKKELTFYGFVLSGLFLVLGLGYLFSPKDLAFRELMVSPFLVISVILSQHFKYIKSFIISGIYSISFFLLVYLQTDFEVTETILNIKNLQVPFWIFFVSPLVGFVSEKRTESLNQVKQNNQKKEESIRYLKNKKKLAEQENIGLKKILLNKEETILVLYELSKKLNKIHIEEIFEGLVEILSESFRAKGIGIYYRGTVGKNFSHLEFTDELKEYGAEIDPIENNEMIKYVIDHKKIFHQNLSEEDFDYEGREKEYELLSLIVPIVVDQDIRAIVLVEEIPFIHYRSDTFRMIDMLAEWAASSIDLSDNYNYVKTKSIIDEQFNTFNFSYFQDRLGEEFEVASTYMLPLELLRIEIEFDLEVIDLKKKALTKLVVELCKKHLGKKDCLSVGPNQSIWVIMPLSSEKNVKEYCQNLNQGIKQALGPSLNVKLQFYTGRYNPSLKNPDDLMKECA